MRAHVLERGAPIAGDGDVVEVLGEDEESRGEEVDSPGRRVVQEVGAHVRVEDEPVEEDLRYKTVGQCL